MPSPRYTVRLPAPLDEAVQRHLASSGTPFAVLMREALSAYLADIPPTGALTPADRYADTLQALHIDLAALTRRVEILEATLARLHQLADRPADRIADMLAAYADSVPTDADRMADTPLTPADTPTAPRRRGVMRARILALLAEHPEGLTADEMRFYLKPDRPLGDTLQGMVRQGLLTREGDRKGGRYVALAAGARP